MPSFLHDLKADIKRNHPSLYQFFSKKMNAFEYLQELKSKEFKADNTIHLTASSDSWREKRERDAKEDDQKRKICKWMFGKDPYCLDWDYKNAKLMPAYDNFFVIGRASENYLKEHKKEILLYNCMCMSYAILDGEAAASCSDFREALFCLKGGLDDAGVNMTAKFRHDMVWPYWGSSQAFWEDMVAVWEESFGKYNVYWPTNAPKMTAAEVMAYFEAERFERGLRFVKLVISRFGPRFKISDVSLHFPFTSLQIL